MTPSLLYCIEEPVGEVITIVPVGIEQVGCVTVASGTAGASGTALIVTLVPAEIQPSAFFAVRVYVPDVKALNVTLDW